MIGKGFMRLHRNLLDWEWFDNSQMVHIWIYFLLKANYQDSKWRGIDIPRGSFVTSLGTISNETRLTIREVRTCISKLKATGEVTIKATNKYSIVTVCNYDRYNFTNDDSDKQNDKQNDKQATTDKEINNNNNIIIKEKETNVSSKKDEKDELFEECWKAYKRKGKKKKSLEQWKKLNNDERQQVLPHIRQYVASRELQYQQDFERYLRDRTFKGIIVKGNTTLYDPEQSSDKEYRPTADGVFLYWDEKNKRLIFNGDIEHLNDGYTSDNRPDGATVAWGMYEWKWSRNEKRWVKDR